MGTLIGSLMILRNDWHFIYDNGIIIFLSAFRLEIRSISKKFRDLSHIKWYVRLAFRSNEDLDICWQLLKLSDKHMKIHYSALYICTYLEFSIKNFRIFFQCYGYNEVLLSERMRTFSRSNTWADTIKSLSTSYLIMVCRKRLYILIKNTQTLQNV